jgi:hypothetical protein
MKPFQAFPRWFRIIGIASMMVLLAHVQARQSNELEQHQYEGNLGKNRIGMTILRKGNRIDGGHYFYQKFLKDIPITGSVKDTQITLMEDGGGTFQLHFVGNGSAGDHPLDFENSIGMDGTWKSADGTRLYPVSLRGTLIRPGADNVHRYSDVTSESDTAFESRVQSLLRAVLHGDKNTAVRFISYPLNVNFPNGKMRKFRDSTEILAAWNDIFTPAMISELQGDLPHDMFVRNGMAMLGTGEAWFDAKGLATVNLPSPTTSATP